MLVHLWQDGVRVRPNAFQDSGVEPLRAQRVHGFLAPRQIPLGIVQGRRFSSRCLGDVHALTVIYSESS